MPERLSIYFLVTTVALLAPAAVSAQSPVVREYVAAYQQRFPAASSGMFFDNSLAARDRWIVTQRSFERRVARFKAPPLDVQILRDHLEAARELDICHRELWNVSPLTGWLSEFVRKLQRGGADTAQARRFVDNETRNLQVGLRLGYVAPQRYVTATLEQVDRALAGTTIQSESVRHALTAYGDYLRKHYLPRARTSVGVDGLPRGRQCFEALVRRYTSLSVSAAQLDSMGRALLASSAPVSIATNAAPVTSSDQEILAHADSLLARAWRVSSGWFNKLPNVPPPLVKPWPEAGRNGPSAIYVPATENEPATILLNLAGLRAEGAQLYLDRLMFHEGVPGHHLQRLLSRSSDLSAITNVLGSTAFTEGWAVYASNLADEMGLYTSEISKTPLRRSAIDDAMAMIIQTGLHVHGWIPQQAIDTLVRYTGVGPEEAEQQIDYFINAPAHALAYPVGARTIEQLRARSARLRGSRFNVKDFHDVILRNGPVPLTILSKAVDDWIRSR